ncbi:MAG: S8 family serine peptidase, partial [bacterium]|nr:S8 family serine peptidase [bacterium]
MSRAGVRRRAVRAAVASVAVVAVLPLWAGDAGAETQIEDIEDIAPPPASEDPTPPDEGLLPDVLEPGTEPPSASDPARRYHSLGSQLSTLAVAADYGAGDGLPDTDMTEGAKPPTLPGGTNSTVSLSEPMLLTIQLDGNQDGVLAFLAEHGITPANVGSDYLEAAVPPTLLAQLARQTGVARVRELPTPQRLLGTTTSEGLAVHEASRWHFAGHEGQGVKIGVIDAVSPRLPDGTRGWGKDGFTGLLARMGNELKDGYTGLLARTGNELPLTVKGMCFPGPGVATFDLRNCDARHGSDHGTQVAETVMDIAPEASLYISNASTFADLQRAVEWMHAQGVKVIVYSIGWTFHGAADGSSPITPSPLNTVKWATDRGIVWVNSAGNGAQRNWYGPFTDTDDDGYHEWWQEGGSVDEGLRYSWTGIGRSEVTVFMRWDDTWGGAAKDLDLQLIHRADATAPWRVVAASADTQNGGSADYPYEAITRFEGVGAGEYEIVVKKRAGSAAPAWLQLRIFGRHTLSEHRVAASSIATPADSPSSGLLAAGSADVKDVRSVSSYSARGPTPDGRTKPDLVAGTCSDISGKQYPFCGTSAAAPHLAGLAALVRQRFPTLTATQVAAYLKSNAAERGETGPDNEWGHGFAQLPSTGLPAVDRDADCVTDLAGNGTVQGHWTGVCESSGDTDVFGRFYQFSLAERRQVTIDLDSSRHLSALYLRSGLGQLSGEPLHSDTGSWIDVNFEPDSQISQSLPAGDYTIEATTIKTLTTDGDTRLGAFTLTVAGLATDAPTAGPEVSIAAGAAITEGASASFTISADPVPTAPLAVSLVVNDLGAFAASGAAGPQTVTIPTSGSVTHSVATVDDKVGEADGVITATLVAGGSYTVSETQGAATVAVADNEPVVSIAGDADPITEGETATFTVSVTPAPSAPLRLGVTLKITQRGDYAAPGETGTWVITVPTTGSAQLTIATVDDVVGERTGGITATILRAPGLNMFAAQRIAEVIVWDNEPVITVTRDLDVTEGEDAVFSVWARPPPSVPLSVTLTITQQGDYAEPGATGTRTVTIPTAGSGRLSSSAQLTVATVDDDAVEADGAITATLQPSQRYRTPRTISRTTSGMEATVAVADNDGLRADPPADPSCMHDLAGPGKVGGEWTGACLTATGTSGKSAEYYSFRLDQESRVTIDLRGEQGGSRDTYLYLRKGRGERSAALVAQNDDGRPRSGAYPLSALLEVTLAAGDYTIEATTYGSRVRGPFTLEVTGIPPQTPRTQRTPTTPQTPEVSVSGTAGVTEGVGAVFTVTAAPAPPTPLTVSLTVTQQGDYAGAGATGTKTVTVPTSGSVTHTVATVDDSTDEADGGITATLSAGQGYTVSSSGGVHTVSVSDDDVPEISVTAGADIDEGGSASFTITADPAPHTSLTVSLTVTQQGDYAAAGATGTKTVTVATSGSVTHTVATTDDSADEADGSVTVTLKAGSGYTVSSAQRVATVGVSDDDAPPATTPEVSVTAGAGITEGGNAGFTITASPAPKAPLAVSVTVTQRGDYGVSTG